MVKVCFLLSFALIGISGRSPQGASSQIFWDNISSGIHMACTSISYISLGALAYHGWQFLSFLGHRVFPIASLFGHWTPAAPVAHAAAPASVIGATTIHGQFAALLLTTASM